MMKRRKNIRALAGKAFPVILCALLLACDMKPKTFGGQTLNLGGTDTATSETFKLNFAYRDPAAAAPGDRIIYLQGASNTSSTMKGICNSAGTGCECSFLDAGGVELEKTSAATISYDTTGNYFRCTISAANLGALSSVVLKNISETKQTNTVTVDTSLTLAKIIGDLALSKVRYIYKYNCDFNYWNKTGTTANSITCLDGSLVANTDTVNPDLNIIIVPYRFFLFADNLQSNFGSKTSDILYNSGTGETFCNIQLKRIACTSSNVSNGTPVLDFGLYAESTGVFNTSVALTASPVSSSAIYGYAASTSSWGGATVCPPGLERRIFYKTTPAVIADTNMQAGLTDTIVGVPTVAPADMQISQKTGGNCGDLDADGATKPDRCTLPAAAPAALTTSVYSSAGQTEFCVIPSTLLP